ncbi:MAG: ribonuclease D [Proteobacteria bacterium]|nr:ribonuclease D [Pseudomonadota bacterium]
MNTSFFNTSKVPSSFIRSSQELKLFCENLTNGSFITLDTEFKRENTFWPDLCLIQIANPRSVVLIDPLSYTLDLSPLTDVLQNPEIVKVFHAGYEDLEIFLRLTGHLPCSVFDTQIAAQFCGFGDSVGYHTLVKSLCSIDLDKSQQRADWTKRPLSPSQIEYASLDVFYLRQIYETLFAQLQEKDRLSWAHQEMKDLFILPSFQRNGDELWQRLKSQKKNISPQILCIIKEITHWREQTARTQNLPRSWIISDAEIILLGQQKLSTLEELIKVKPLARYFKMQQAKSLFECYKKAFQIPSSLWPQANVIHSLTPKEKALFGELRTLLTQQAEAYGISPSLIATRKDLEDFAREKESSHDLSLKIMKGWREEVFGKVALKHKIEFEKTFKIN